MIRYIRIVSGEGHVTGIIRRIKESGGRRRAGRTYIYYPET